MEKSLYPHSPVLIVDDDIYLIETINDILQHFGINNILTCSDSRKVMDIVKNNNISTILLDLGMPHISGREILEMLCKDYPEIPVVIVTGERAVESAVDSIRSGAYDYLTKPVDPTRLITTIERAVKVKDITGEISFHKDDLKGESLTNPEVFTHIITRNKEMISIFNYVEAISNSNQPVLITGESGTGKGEIAKSVHKAGNREGEYITINIAGLDDTMFSDTLFGHKKGAFTGALDDRKGMIKQAEGGTLFLDEIGDIGFQSQVKLLRLIQERIYLPLGSDTPEQANVRIICATNRDIKNSEKFRKDLYYRLNTHHIHLEALKKRQEDIPLLLDHFLEIAANEMNKKKPTFPNELITLLNNYDFPGNIRELRSMIYDAVAEHKTKMLSMKVFLKKINPKKDDIFKPVNTTMIDMTSYEKLPSLEEFKHLLINEAIKRTDGNQSLAAKLIGVSRSTFLKYLNN